MFLSLSHIFAHFQRSNKSHLKLNNETPLSCIVWKQYLLYGVEVNQMFNRCPCQSFQKILSKQNKNYKITMSMAGTRSYYKYFIGVFPK